MLISIKASNKVSNRTVDNSAIQYDYAFITTPHIIKYFIALTITAMTIRIKRISKVTIAFIAANSVKTSLITTTVFSQALFNILKKQTNQNYKYVTCAVDNAYHHKCASLY